MSVVDLGTATAEDFAGFLNTSFKLNAGGERTLTLLDVRRLGQAVRQGGAFSLLFVAKDNRPFPQAIYSLSHPALGTVDIFLVPIGPVPGGGSGYEAVFT